MLTSLPAHHQTLLGCLGTPQDLQGAYLAADKLSVCFQSASHLFGPHVSIEWAKEAGTLVSTLQTLSAHNPLIANRLLSGNRGYDLFIGTHQVGVTRAIEEQINGAFGLIAAHCISRTRIIPTNTIDAWVQLRKVGRHRRSKNPEWENLARAFPTNLAEVHKWQERSGVGVIQDFLHWYGRALAKPIPPPASLVQTRKGDFPDLVNFSPASGQPGHARTQALAAQEADVAEKQKPGNNLIGWLLQRANHGGYISFFGESDRWERLSRAELGAMCSRIAGHLMPGDPDCRYALFAVISLCSSLPSQKAATLPLLPNNKIWLDMARKSIRWNLRAVLDPNEPLSKRAPAPKQTIDIWLPALAADLIGKFHQAHPNAQTLAELISAQSGDSAAMDLIKGYRTWLCGVGYQSRHGALDARFARALGQMYLNQHGDVMAAVLGLDFSECAMGMLHYAQFEPKFLYQQTQQVYVDLGLGDATAFIYTKPMLGSRHAMAPDDFFAAIRQLLQEASTARRQMIQAQTLQALCAAYDRLVHCRLLTVISLTGARNQRLDRMTWGALYGHAAYAFVSDKDTDEYSLSRVIPIGAVLRRVLDSHAQEIHLASSAADRLGWTFSDVDRQRVFGRARSKVCFFSIAATSQTARHSDLVPQNKRLLVRQEVRWAAVEAISRQFFGRKSNVGRHTWVSMLLAQGVDRWLIKTLTGHARVRAEPFADGQTYFPKQALAQLAQAMEWALRPLTPSVLDPAPDTAPPCADYFAPNVPIAVLSLAEPRTRVPTRLASTGCGAREFARVLPKPIDHHTLLSITVVEHLRMLLLNGMGPAQAHARLLSCLLLLDWIEIADVEIIWSAPTPFQRLTNCTVAATYSRPDCRTQIRRPLCGPTLIPLAQIKTGLKGRWLQSCRDVHLWLQEQLPHLMWPAREPEGLASLAAMISRWSRFNLPPFLLTATSAKLTSPSASADSMLRLLGRAQVPDLSALKFPAPVGRLRQTKISASPSALSRAMNALNEVHNTSDSKGGENQKRMSKLQAVITQMDCSEHGPANLLKDWILAECRLWCDAPSTGKIVVSSLATYTSNLKPTLTAFAADIDFKVWRQEWHSFIEKVEEAATGETELQRLENRAKRLTAAKRLVKRLRQENYAIPLDLFSGADESVGNGLRRSASSTLLMQSDKDRIIELVSDHFADLPFEQSLATLYGELRFAAPLRSGEAEVLSLDAVSELDQLIVTTGGFSNLKSKNARRVLEIPKALAARFRQTAKTIKEAYPQARWLFLLDDSSDRTTIEQIKLALSAAIKQVTGDVHARAHATRCVQALQVLTPGWEALLRSFLRGEVSTAACADYCSLLTQRENAVLIDALRQTGHGHPRTFLNYYFAIGDLLLSVFAAASLKNYSTVQPLTALSAATTPAAACNTNLQTAHIDASVGEWMRLKRHSAASCHHLPHFFDQEVAAALEQPKRNPVVRPGPEPDDAKSLISSAQYLAVRMIGMSPQAASARLNLSGVAMSALDALLETIEFKTTEFERLRHRHQRSADKAWDARAKKEIHYLLSDEGRQFAHKLLGSDPRVLNAFSQALDPRPACSCGPLDMAVLSTSFKAYANCLPVNLAVLVQFKNGQISARDALRLSSPKDRVSVGTSGNDWGNQPRILVIMKDRPRHYVARARLTANTRYLIQAARLMNFGELD